MGWLNLFCLDAPLVAVSWSWLIAQSFGIQVGVAGLGGLFLTAWLIYLADRLVDSRSLPPGGGTLSLRQRFCRRHPLLWIAGIVLLLLAQLGVLRVLDLPTLRAGAALASVALLYLLINQTAQFIWRIVPAKELTIGFVFAGGVMVPLATSLTSEVFLAWLLFGCLCSLNCICIAVWERELDVAQQRVSIATALPGVAARLPLMVGAIALMSSAAALLSLRGAAVYEGIAVSSLLLGALHLCGERVQRDHRTALADLALLLPAALLLLVR